MQVSVVIPALDAAATLGEALAAVTRQEASDPFEVLVVDDGSSDETAAIAERALGSSAVLRQSHQGPAAARNRGVARARGSVLAFTDADCVPEPDWLAAGVAALARADLVQGRVRPTPGQDLRPLDRSLWISRPTGYYETANLFVRRELFERIGGFESWLEPKVGKPLAEDVWFGWRARRAGARFAFSPDAVVNHAIFGRTLREYAGERRRLRHFPEMAAKMPELRGQSFYARYFLNRRSAAFDAGLAGAAAALLTRSPLPLLAAAPYAALNVDQAINWRRGAPLALAGSLAADVIGFAALLRGSCEQRALLL